MTGAKAHRAVGYVRVSTEEQTLGPDAQRAALAAWSLRSGAELVEVFVDVGSSGALGVDRRPVLARALGALVDLGAGLLVVAKRDRLARDVGVALAIEATARHLGAKIVAADGSPEGDAPEARFARGVVDLAAQFERDQIAARTRAALAVLKARGFYVGGKAPFGARPGPGGRLEPHEGERAILERIDALRVKGASLREIVAALAAEGLTSRAGKPLGLTQVARLARRSERAKP